MRIDGNNVFVNSYELGQSTSFVVPSRIGEIPQYAVSGTITSWCDSGWQKGALSDYSQADREYYDLLRSSFNNIVLESDIYDRLRGFENKYHEDSMEFYREWLEGRKEDTEDFNNWAALYSLLY